MSIERSIAIEHILRPQNVFYVHRTSYCHRTHSTATEHALHTHKCSAGLSNTSQHCLAVSRTPRRCLFADAGIWVNLGNQRPRKTKESREGFLQICVGHKIILRAKEAKVGEVSSWFFLNRAIRHGGRESMSNPRVSIVENLSERMFSCFPPT